MNAEKLLHLFAEDHYGFQPQANYTGKLHKAIHECVWQK